MGMLSCISPGALLPEWPAHVHFEAVATGLDSVSQFSDSRVQGEPSVAMDTSVPKDTAAKALSGKDISAKMKVLEHPVRVNISAEELRVASLEPEGIAHYVAEVARVQALPPNLHFSLLIKAREAASFANGVDGRRRNTVRRLRAILALISGFNHESEGRLALETFMQTQPELPYELIDLVAQSRGTHGSEDKSTFVPLSIQVYNIQSNSLLGCQR